MASLGLWVATACAPSAAEEAGATTRVEIRVVEADTGEVTPAMVCIRGLDDGTLRAPPDGRVITRPPQKDDFVRGVELDPDPDWVGPARLMTGEANGRARPYGAAPSLPYWNEPISYATSGDFSIALPAGRWRLAVARGMEFVPVFEDFETDGSGVLEKTVRMERWIDLPALGWISGDVHVHHPNFRTEHNRFLFRYARAEDVHVSNLLAMTHHGGVDFDQLYFGKGSRLQDGDYWLVSGQEGPRTSYRGHVIGLNIDALALDLSTYELYDVAYEQLHASPEAIVGWAHFAAYKHHIERGFSWNVTTEALEFVEMLQFRQMNREDYYDYLDMGFVLTACAGSDVPWGSTLGEVRTFVHTGEEFDPDRWFAALKAGRTFVSNGPALLLSVDGELPGAHLARDAGATVAVAVTVKGHPALGLPDFVRVVGSAGELGAAENPGGERELTLELEVPVAESQWIAAWTECDNGAVAHTSPVYVEVDGRPTWSRKRGPELVRERIETILRLEAEYDEPIEPRRPPERKALTRNREGVLERMRRARAFYEALSARMQAE